MLNTKIITRAEIQQYKQLSDSGNDAKLNQVIIESQLSDIKPLLGERLFNAVLKDVRDATNTNGSTYTALLNGGDYTVSGTERFNPGLKSVLANHVYGRTIMWGDVVDNPFGASFKINPQSSERIDMATKKSFYNENKNFAYNLWVDVRKFLILTEEPLFYKCQEPVKQIKLNKIGGNTPRKYGSNYKYRRLY